MGENVINLLTKIKFKIWRVTFLKLFLPIKKFGMDNRFSRKSDLPPAHSDETRV